METTIRPMSPGDLEAVVRLQPEGWGDLRPPLAFYLQFASCETIVAEHKGQVIGVANGTQFGPTAWIGPIIVDAAFRGQGAGKLLTKGIVSIMQGKGCRTLQLIATDLGRPVYEKLGFAADGEYCFMRKSDESIVKPFPEPVPMRLMTGRDLPQAGLLDRRATGEDRSALIGVLWPNGGWVVPHADGSGLRAFQLNLPWAAGTIIAEDAEAGCALLHRWIDADGKRSLAVLGGNRAAVAYAEGEGFTVVKRAVRMRLGEPLPWRPEMVFSRLSGSVG
ncbi:Acetyltransferase (GNAT) family protein [Paenibacillus konkukensis]|uniref:Acetyltransferase (GNAT) family protein n=1 Tax=Paenibacillus konkukensis TaxID=2020716 RepID=A0ABY4RTK9_9BACL|nr:GNAT family N-acetyltransferase [Paenibacillus konkukensis]UQZ85300.1 Acetyltransferase (GNAT) family protein [Paenibacillus konkukensis]